MEHIKDHLHVRQCIDDLASHVATVVNGDDLGKWYTEFDAPPFNAFEDLLYLCWGSTLAKPLPCQFNKDRLRSANSGTYPGDDLIDLIYETQHATF